MTRALYAGTFDPITNGHLDLIQRSYNIFSNLTLAVAENTNKKSLFSIDERLELANLVVNQLGLDIKIISFNGLLVDLIQKEKIDVVIRGLRVISDFEYEMQLALMNRKLFSNYEVVFLMPNERNMYLSSSIVREISKLGGDISKLVPPCIENKIKEKIVELFHT